MAIGAAQVMGYKLMTNFNRPYSAYSISEFWKRWHISLSTWFRDYLYIPMGGNRKGNSRMYFNLLFVFMISGLWHGANWTYIVWGALHGLYLVGALFMKKWGMSLDKLLRLPSSSYFISIYNLISTYILVLIAWIFFRAASITDGLYIVQHLFDGFLEWMNVNLVFDQMKGLGLSKYEFVLSILLILLLLTIEYWQRKTTNVLLLKKYPVWFRWGIYVVSIMFILVLGVFDNTQFIYFQF